VYRLLLLLGSQPQAGDVLSEGVLWVGAPHLPGVYWVPLAVLQLYCPAHHLLYCLLFHPVQA
jgi:hypothetical protein